MFFNLRINVHIIIVYLNVTRSQVSLDARVYRVAVDFFEPREFLSQTPADVRACGFGTFVGCFRDQPFGPFHSASKLNFNFVIQKCDEAIKQVGVGAMNYVINIVYFSGHRVAFKL